MKLPSVPFKDRHLLPDVAGIYFVYSEKKLLYIGKAVSLVRRWKHHHRLEELRNFDDVQIKWLEISADKEELASLEKAFIESLRPALNSQLINHGRKQPTSAKPTAKHTYSRKEISFGFAQEAQCAGLDEIDYVVAMGLV